ncbi:MAG TPA: ParB N-terminal domain-containing protein, partial [Spirochaetota bacterium]
MPGEEFIQSVKKYGILEYPVVIERFRKYVIVLGHHRLAVAKSLGHSSIAVNIWDDFNPEKYEKELLRKMYHREIGPIGRLQS